MMQAGSEFVKSRKAQIGDFVRSTTGEILGNPDQPVDVIFLHNPMPFWCIKQRIPGTDNKFKFVKSFPRNTSNEVMEFEYYGDKDGNEISQNQAGAILHRRYKQFRVFALLPSDLASDAAERIKAESGELPDINKALTPVMLSLQSSSGFLCGKEISTFFTKCAAYKVAIYRYVVALTSVPDTNGTDTFLAWKLLTIPTRTVAADDLEVVKSWSDIVMKRSSSIRVDESAENQA